MDRPARLTTAFVKEVEEPGRYGDGRGGFGLSLLVRPTRDGLGKNWQQRLTVAGKPRSLGLGSFPQVSLSRARTLAVGNATTIRERFPRRSGLDRLLAETADLQAVPTVTDGPTFADVAEESIELRRTSWKPGSKTEAQTRSLLARYINPVLGDIAIDQVTPALVLEVLTPIWHEKAETGRKVKRNIQAVFNFAIGEGYLDAAGDPTHWVKVALGRQRQVVQHHPAVHFSQVGEVLEYVRSSGSFESKRLALEFLILTAARTGEVRGARWAEVDFDKATWTIPANRMKNGREHRIPLPAAAVDVLRRARREWANPDDLVFPDRSGKTMISQDGLRQLLRREFAATSHGFRSSFRDWAAEQTDFPAEIVEHALAHLEGGETVRAYRRADYFERRRELMGAWADFVTE